MNKYQEVNVGQMPIPEINSERYNISSLAGGVHYEVSPRALPFDAATELDDVRFDDEQLLKDFGWASYVTISGLGTLSNIYEYFIPNSTRVLVMLDIVGPVVGTYSVGVQWGTGPTVITSAGADITSGTLSDAVAVTMYGKFIYTAGGRPQIWDGGAGPATYLSNIVGFTAKYLAPFGTRVLAMYCDSDGQKVRWNASGDLTNTAWAAAGSGELILAEVRSDTADLLRGGVQLGSNTFALFRQRSIWRGFNTGNATQAIGFTPLVDGLGTDSPLSIVNLGIGAGFLGSDVCPYILTPEGTPIPVGKPIQRELRRILTSGTQEARSGFDPFTGEWWILFPSLNLIWAFDVTKFINEKKLVWHRKVATGMRSIASSGALVPSISGAANHSIWLGTSGTSYKSLQTTTTKAGASFNGTWTSRPLNKTSIASLTELIFFYNTPSNTTFTLKVSGDGGETWHETKTVTLLATTKKDAQVNVGCLTTGADLRFQIIFDQTVACKITGYMPVIVERGPFEYE